VVSRATRRDWLKGLSAACGAISLSAIGGAVIAQQSAQDPNPIDPRELPRHAGRTVDETFGYCLNTSTIRGQKLPLVKELEIAAAAGFQAVEPWMNEVDQFVSEGGRLGDLKKRITDLGLSVESVIAFAEWIVDDDARRSKALEQLQREMETVAAFGGKRIACPPSGATNVAMTDLRVIADRYRTVCELAEKTEI
jgi:2-keto-myo-inositol isomerase